MATNQTQLVNSEVSFFLGDLLNEGPLNTTVSVLQLGDGDTDYFSGQVYDWPEAFCERIIYKVGATPGEATITVQTERSAPGIPVGGVNGFIPYTLRGTNKFTPFTASAFTDAAGQAEAHGLWKVTIRYADSLGVDRVNANAILFSGYITRMRIIIQSKEFSTFEITCKDARWFLAKHPMMGRIHYNPTFEQFVYNFDSPMIMNEGQQPNRLRAPFGGAGVSDDLCPAFIRSNHNRYNSDSSSPDFRRYISDTELEAAILAKQIGGKRTLRNGSTVTDDVVADKWTPAHAWNYSRLIMNPDLLGVVVDDPAITNLLTPSPWLRHELSIRPIHRGRSGQQVTGSVGAEFYEPRSTVGEDPDGGAASLITGLGETDPQGVFTLEFLDDLCKRVGNMALAVDYTEKNGGHCEIYPIRTTLATDEDPSVTYGKRGRESFNAIWIPTDQDDGFMPEVQNLDVSISYEDTFSRAHIIGGKIWVQVTLSTMGQLAFTDHLGYFHGAYDPPLAVEWRPWINLPTLAWGFTLEQLTTWLALPEVQQTSWRYPDAFRTLIIPDDQDYKALWDQSTDRGFQRFFERDRQMMANLVSSVYEVNKGIWRGDRVRLPVKIWRAYRGTRVLTDKSTKFGDNTTEATVAQPSQGPTFRGDLKRLSPGVELLNDGGRIGFRLDINARMLANYPFEEGTQGPATSPWSWNGLRAEDDEATEAQKLTALKFHARPYEMFMTIPLEVDESLARDIMKRTAGARINTDGPEMTLVRQAGDAYNLEMTSHSMISLPFDLQDKIADPAETEQNRKYNDSSSELLARAQIMANRQFGPGIEGQIDMPSMDLSWDAGYRVDNLRQDRGANKQPRDIKVKTITETVIQDFRNQKTSIGLRSLR